MVERIEKDIINETTKRSYSKQTLNSAKGNSKTDAEKNYNRMFKQQDKQWEELEKNERLSMESKISQLDQQLEEAVKSFAETRLSLKYVFYR